jgi:hypothetical protein
LDDLHRLKGEWIPRTRWGQRGDKARATGQQPAPVTAGGSCTSVHGQCRRIAPGPVHRVSRTLTPKPHSLLSLTKVLHGVHTAVSLQLAPLPRALCLCHTPYKQPPPPPSSLFRLFSLPRALCLCHKPHYPLPPPPSSLVSLFTLSSLPATLAAPLRTSGQLYDSSVVVGKVNLDHA